MTNTALQQSGQDAGGWELLPLIRGYAHFLAHDLGNAMSALSITLDLLERQELPERSRELLQRSQNVQGRLQRMVDALGALGGARPRGQQIDLDQLLEQLLNTLKLRRRFQLEIDLEEHQLDGDPHLLELCLRLLLRNAAEATPAGGRIGVRFRHPPGRSRLEIWDEGEGVPASIQEHLFRRPTSSKAGNGVGLLLVRAAVEGALGGTVSYAANQPQGSRFILELPG